MFCGKCGKEMKGHEKYCPSCGFPMQNRDETNNNKEMTLNKKKQGKVLSTVVVGVIIFAGIFLLFSTLSSSAEKVALKACKSILKEDMKAYYKLLAPPYQDYMVGDNGWFSTEEEFQEDLLSMEKDNRRDMIISCGENFKAKCEVTSKIECDKDTLNSVKRELSRDYYYDSEKVKGAALVTVSIYVSGEGEERLFMRDVTCIKIGHSWYVHRPSLNSL